jgi:hypothetical protein
MFQLIKIYFLLSIFLQSTLAINFKIINKCNYPINIYSHENFQFNDKCLLNSNNECTISYNYISSGLIKTSLTEIATLFEFSINEQGIWYDLSVIPPGSGDCYNYNECRTISNKSGYNIPVNVEIINKNNQNIRNNNCVNLSCLDEQCPDAYLYPYDDIKTKFCTLDVNFNLIYCPTNLNTNIIPNINLEEIKKNNESYEIKCN